MLDIEKYRVTYCSVDVPNLLSEADLDSKKMAIWDSHYIVNGNTGKKIEDIGKCIIRA